MQRMLDAGAVMEMGTVCTIKRAGDFGFIKTLTRKEEVFFKLDDVADLTSGAQIKEVLICIKSLLLIKFLSLFSFYYLIIIGN